MTTITAQYPHIELLKTFTNTYETLKLKSTFMNEVLCEIFNNSEKLLRLLNLDDKDILILFGDIHKLTNILSSQKCKSTIKNISNLNIFLRICIDTLQENNLQAELIQLRKIKSTTKNINSMDIETPKVDFKSIIKLATQSLENKNNFNIIQ